MSRLLIFMLALLLGACTTVPSSTVPPLPERSAEELEQLWLQHRQKIGQLIGWSLVGRIVVKTDDEGWNGELRWSQSADEFQIEFNAPFGQGAFQMDGNSQVVELRLSDGQVFSAPDAESLLLTHIGWHLPLGEFRYWVSGLPGVQSVTSKTLNNDGQLAELKQDQWRISYPDYAAVGDVMMPRKVYFKNHDLSVRLVIDEWILSHTRKNTGQVHEERL